MQVYGGRSFPGRGVVLGQCSSLATLNLACNDIGDAGAGSLAGVLGQCSSLAKLNPSYNYKGNDGATSLAGVLGQCSSLATLGLEGNGMGVQGIAMIRIFNPKPAPRSHVLHSA